MSLESAHELCPDNSPDCVPPSPLSATLCANSPASPPSPSVWTLYMDGHFRQGLPLHRLRERSLAVSRRFHLKDFSQTHLKIFSLTSPEMQMAFFHLVYMPGHKLPHSIGFLHAAVTWLRMGRIESSSGKSHDTVLRQFVLKELTGPTIHDVLQKLDPA